ncbi:MULTISPECIES: lysylphosphatidylglycerol synthase transmembrane domain-containing protein [Sphingobacterium]|uniref:Lysylphosphatidylglycerol synthase domain-containing protein n=1 Tax=Sphingobacterium populi TaxID=1812824 RepID=A0ABW5UDJ1_9SPHI|nr:lysylphosphatidylglycerol synthase domain-containing protein [Sphingobacterium sp. CFCC 11742]
MNKTQKTYLNIFIKVLIVALTSWFVYSKISHQQNLKQFNALISEFDGASIWLILSLVVVMMLANWFLEVVKWRHLSKKIEPLSWWTAIRSVFCGLTWAIFTPNRIGEYGGRVLLLHPENRASGAVAMGVGLFAQLVLTSVFGALSIAWFVQTFLPTPVFVKLAVWMIASIYASAFLVLYFNVQWIDALVGKVKFLTKVKPFFAILENFTSRELSHVLLISFARFTIFTSQYMVLMLFFLPELPMLSMILMIFILFFVQAAVPSLDLFDFSVRSFVASNLYAYITTQEIAVMAIVSFVWFVNLILPAIIGTFFVFQVNYVGANGKS